MSLCGSVTTAVLHSTVRLMLTSALVMLPVLTHGTVSAFLTIALPKLQKPNPTGLIIDLYQVSWLGKTFIEQVMGWEESNIEGLYAMKP